MTDFTLRVMDITVSNTDKNCCPHQAYSLGFPLHIELLMTITLDSVCFPNLQDCQLCRAELIHKREPMTIIWTQLPQITFCCFGRLSSK